MPDKKIEPAFLRERRPQNYRFSVTKSFSSTSYHSMYHASDHLPRKDKIPAERLHLKLTNLTAKICTENDMTSKPHKEYEDDDISNSNEVT